MKLQARYGGIGYDIVIKRGILSRIGMMVRLGERVMLVTDSGVPKRYIKTVAAQCANPTVLILSEGEGSKSIEAWQRIVSTMQAQGFGRGDIIVALGGGVVGDVAGFAAATYMRGVRLCHIPTTTTAQVDSAIGGKTALNLSGVKNTVGAFHHPCFVAIDPATLATLPARQHAAGLAEALKMGLVGSRELFELLEHQPIEENIERILYHSLHYKLQITQQDEQDNGNRRLLNFGHTIGHALEAASGFGENRLLHGEAVALGMLPMLESRSLARRTRAVMKKLGLPLRHSVSAEQILKLISSDKKREDGNMYTVIRVKTPGGGYLETIDFEELRLLVQAE